MLHKVKAFFANLYGQLVKIDDSPNRLALGFALGVFLGVLPGTGPLAALTLALIFRLNKAAALLGSVLTNSWFTLVTFTLALRVGALITGVHWQTVQTQASALLSHFSWKSLFDVSLSNVVVPLLTGYAVISFVCAVIGYAGVRWALERRHRPG